jgi:hypothetical protein
MIRREDMKDPTEDYRRDMIESGQVEREAEDAEISGRFWTTEELRKEFTVEGFAAPFVLARRRRDGVKGTLMFRYEPRLYFDWQPDEVQR